MSRLIGYARSDRKNPITGTYDNFELMATRDGNQLVIEAFPTSTDAGSSITFCARTNSLFISVTGAVIARRGFAGEPGRDPENRFIATGAYPCPQAFKIYA